MHHVHRLAISPRTSRNLLVLLTSNVLAGTSPVHCTARRGLSSKFKHTSRIETRDHGTDCTGTKTKEGVIMVTGTAVYQTRIICTRSAGELRAPIVPAGVLIEVFHNCAVHLFYLIISRKQVVTLLMFFHELHERLVTAT